MRAAALIVGMACVACGGASQSTNDAIAAAVGAGASELADMEARDEARRDPPRRTMCGASDHPTPATKARRATPAMATCAR